MTLLYSGRVRIARHTKTKQYAAVKIVSKTVLVNSRISLDCVEQDTERILLGIEREIVIMKLIEHPNILRLYDVWETSSELYLILEYVEGGELFDYICEKGRLSSSEALAYFQQIISAIDYCHRFNIAHRDLKPENLLLDSNKNIKVADFGMAAWQKNGSNGMLKTACGSPHYAAPEVVMGMPYNGSTSDIWSCGIILFALLAGKLPFDDDDLGALLEKVKVGKFDMPQHINRQAKHLISRMLEKDVKKRITIPEILAHPFYTSQPAKPVVDNLPNLDEIARPIADVSGIDPDVFSNLRTLWHGTPDQDIIDRLTNNDRTWEKGVYHLLVQYRARRLENYDEEDDSSGLSPKMRRQHRSGVGRPRSPADLPPPRPGPPTPDRAKKSHTNGQQPSKAFRSQQPVPEIMLHLPSPSPSANKHVELDSLPLDNTTSPTLSPFSPSSPMWEALNLPPLNVPDVQDEKIQHFFQQIADHLNVMQLRATGMISPAPSPNLTWVSTPGRSSSTATNPVTPSLPTPVSMEYRHRSDDPRESAYEDTPSPRERNNGFLSPVSNAFGLGISKVPPLNVRRVVPQTTSGREKENVPLIHSRDGNLGKKSSMKGNNSKVKKERKVHIVEPAAEKNPRKNSFVGASPVSPALSDYSLEASGSLPRRGWFGTLFRFKPATFHLLSMNDVAYTRKECRRLLEALGVHVVVPHSDDLGMLKCRLEEMKDPAGILGAIKAVRFRVELFKANAVQAVAGYAVALRFVQEKGALSSFKMIFNRLKKEWELDTPKLPRPEPSPPLSMDNRFGLAYPVN
jgi:serine/threonine-protein kinase HSL1, negative regulator of Swe1 kinase